MPLILCIALYFVIWWMILFAVLPLGVTSQFEAGEVVPGSEGAAPQRPMLLKKAAITTAVTTIVFTIVYLVVTRHLMPHQIFDLSPNIHQ